MSNNATLVLHDSALLQSVCGVNDRNLHVLERVFDAPVLVRGNELRLASGNAELGKAFADVISQAESIAAGGEVVTPAVIESIAAQRLAGAREQLDTALHIPIAETKVYPRTEGQRQLFGALRSSELTFAIGPAGTGKTYIAVAHALRDVLLKRRRKLILTRPVVEAGERLGYLPGDLEQKIAPYLHPLQDAIASLLPADLARRLYENGTIEVAPLAYMRGRNLRECYVLLDEAQNTSSQQMKMFLTRLGEQCTAVVTGDLSQIDLPKGTTSGLREAAHLLRAVDSVAVVRLTQRDVVRSALVQRIVQAYDEFRND